MFTLLYIVLAISTIATVLIIFSPIGSGLKSRRRVRFQNKINKILRKYFLEGNYKKFVRKMKRVGKISSESILDIAVRTISFNQEKIEECFEEDDVTIQEFLKQSKLDKSIRKKLLSGEDYELHQALGVKEILKLQEITNVIISNFNNYSGQGQFFVLYSLLEIKDIDTYNLLVDKKKLRFNNKLLNKLEEFRLFVEDSGAEIIELEPNENFEELNELGDYYG